MVESFTTSPPRHPVRLRRQRQRLRLTQAGLDETFEELHVESGRGLRFWMPLNTDAEPVGVNRLDRLNDAVGCQSTRAELGSDLAHSLMMVAVHADFAAPVDFVNTRVRLQKNRVAVRTSGRVPVR